MVGPEPADKAVVAVSGLQGIKPVAPDQGVVTIAGCNAIFASPTVDDHTGSVVKSVNRIILIRQDHAFDLSEAESIRPSGDQTGCVAGVVYSDPCGAAAEVDRITDSFTIVATDNRIIAAVVTDDKCVVARPAIKLVFVRIARKRIVAFLTIDLIVTGASRQVIVA